MDCVVERPITIAGMFAISMMALNDKENAVPWTQTPKSFMATFLGYRSIKFEFVPSDGGL
jgi:hypothetical protein